MFAAPVMLMLNPVLPTGPMLGKIDNFWILLALVIGSAIWEWLKKKGQTEQTDSGHGEPESPHSTSAPHRPATAPPGPPPAPAMLSRMPVSAWMFFMR